MNFLRTHLVFVVAYGVLLLLLAASSAIAPLALGKMGLVLHLLLALAMATIIVALFMRVRYLGPLLKVVALGSLVFLLCMWIIMPVDYLTRDSGAPASAQFHHQEQVQE